MKITGITADDGELEFRVCYDSGRVYTFPYAKADPRPAADNRVTKVFVDKELADEAFTYLLESGKEGTVHGEQVLEYNLDPEYMAELTAYKLSLETKRRAAGGMI